MIDLTTTIEVVKYILMISPVGVVTWFFTKRHFQKIELKQASVDVDSSITENVIKNLDVYQRMFQDLDDQLLKAHAKIADLQAEIEKIMKEYNELKTEYENRNNK